MASLRRAPDGRTADIAKSQITYAVPIMARAGCSKRNRNRRWVVVEKSERIEPLSEVAGNRVSPRAASAPLVPISMAENKTITIPLVFLLLKSLRAGESVSNGP